MSSLLMHPTYFPDLLSFAHLTQHKIIWETQDHYQKQTYRNRTYIATDQGRQMLNIPIKHTGNKQGRQNYRDVKLDNSYPWQRQHWRSLQTAYRTSPFFEFYEYDLAPLFGKQFPFLMDFNLETIQLVCDCLQCEFPTERNKEWKAQPEGLYDARTLANAKADPAVVTPVYRQVFDDRHGYIPNLSILDLLFNLGPEALTYLENLELDVSDA